MRKKWRAFLRSYDDGGDLSFYAARRLEYEEFLDWVDFKEMPFLLASSRDYSWLLG